MHYLIMSIDFSSTKTKTEFPTS